MTTTLPMPEHIQLAQELLEEADQEFAAGTTLKGSEMLWGAVAHALIAVALQRDWPFNSHGALKNVARRLINVPRHPQWLSESDTAERFHINFYHGHLTELEVNRDLPKARELVVRPLALDS